MRSFKRLGELIQECEKQYIKSGAPLAIAAIVGGGSISALLSGYYMVAALEGLISSGAILYSFRKRIKYIKFKDELTDRYTCSEIRTQKRTKRSR